MPRYRWQPPRSVNRRGPVSLAVRALIELPREIIEIIVRLLNRRWIDMRTYIGGHLLGHPLLFRPWAGTQRNVGSNSIIARYLSPDLVQNRAQDFGDGLITNARGQMFFERLSGDD